MSKYPKMLVEDFPIIPILGSLLLILAYFNNVSLMTFMLSKDGTLMAPVIATIVVILGAGGLMASRLISFALFDGLFRLHNKLLDTRLTPLSDTSKGWFKQLIADMEPIERQIRRPGNHDVTRRRSVSKLTDEQIHGTVHALEIACRDKYPSIATQIDYFYSLYVIFSVVGLAAMSFLAVGIIDLFLLASGLPTIRTVPPPPAIYLADLVFGAALLAAAVRARRFKEQLRMKLLNSCRQTVIEMVSEWFHVRLDADTAS